MCFSPEASFATAALTATLGAVALGRARGVGERLLAATPVLFGVQQAIEGGLWLVLPTAPQGTLAAVLSVAFLVFALIFWPLYAPVAAWMNEPDRLRRRLMLACLVVGCAVAAYFGWRIVVGPREALIANRCIAYRVGGGHHLLLGGAYLLATTAPLFLSTQRTILTLGLVIGAGSVIAYLFYWGEFLSVWCFFAAAASAVIVTHFWALRRRAQPALGA
jgi:hypothetical protein